MSSGHTPQSDIEYRLLDFVLEIQELPRRESLLKYEQDSEGYPHQ